MLSFGPGVRLPVHYEVFICVIVSTEEETCYVLIHDL
jgi:hypothetical protein